MINSDIKNKNILNRFESKETKANKKYNVVILKNNKKLTITMITNDCLELARISAKNRFQDSFIDILC